MYEWLKKNWLYLLLIAGIFIFFTGAGFGYGTIKKQLADVAKYQRETERKLSDIEDGINNIKSISSNIEDRVGSLESSTGRIEDAVDGLESANVSIEYRLDIGEEFTTESEPIIRDSLDLLEIIKAEMDKNSTDSGSD